MLVDFWDYIFQIWLTVWLSTEPNYWLPRTECLAGWNRMEWPQAAEKNNWLTRTEWLTCWNGTG